MRSLTASIWRDRPIWRDRRRRAVLLQLIVLVVLAGGAAVIARATADNLRQRGITAGFAFLSREADFGLGEALPL
jgi:general L-amino acid transport system permease protein